MSLCDNLDEKTRNSFNRIQKEIWKSRENLEFLD